MQFKFSVKSIEFFILAAILSIGFLPGPALLGMWESLTYFHTFGALEAPLSFAIAPRANIGGQGYAFLEVSRTIIQFFSLPLSLTTFRIPSILFGLVSLILFFIISRRYFGVLPALGATALLASNEVFFQYQHMMTVAVVSGAGLLFVIERLQKLEIRYWSLGAWLGLAFALAIVSLHYGPARIFAFILVALWSFKAYLQLKYIPEAEDVKKSILLLGMYSVCGYLFILLILDVRNVLSVTHFYTFLFPKNAEALESSSESTGGGGLLRLLIININIFINSIFGITGKYHAAYSSYLFGDYRYPLMSWSLLFLVLPGFVVCSFAAKKKLNLFQTPWANILVIFSVVALPVLLSSVFFREDGPLATLSTHRMYFSLFPLHFFIAAFLDWTLKNKLLIIFKYFIFISLLMAFIYSLNAIARENIRFQSVILNANSPTEASDDNAVWDNGLDDYYRHSKLDHIHFEQHAQYASAAREIKSLVSREKQSQSKLTRKRIIYYDVNKFTVTPTAPHGLNYIANRNFHSIFLALYLGQVGLQVNPVLMLKSTREPVLFYGLGYEGRPREYSAEIGYDGNKILTYKNTNSLIAEIINITGSEAFDILVTTPEEEAGARLILELNKLQYEYVRVI